MSFFERLEWLMSQNSLSQKEIAIIAGVTSSTISDWKRNKTIPKADAAIKMARHFGISVEELIFGEGELVQGTQVRGKRIIPFSGHADGDVVMVPFFEDMQVSAGPGREASEFSTEKPIPVLRSFLAPYNPKDVFTLEVKGESMTGVHLFNGDIVFFVSTDEPRDGINVISIDNKLLVKRTEYDILGKEIRIVSENERYPVQTIKGEELERVKIVGKVIGWLTRHPY
jgi:SOS-response transcriptional repressor LexA